MANSANGKTKAADPNATKVNPKTWRLVTITAGDWQAQTLEPLRWIRNHHVKAGHLLRLNEVLDLAEMGTPGTIVGTVDSIAACPAIQGGAGRVVLTTVSHLNDFVFHLTLTDSQGLTDTIGVTGYHKIYTEDRGWVDAEALRLDERVRGDHGDLTVRGLSRDPGTFRVYNMSVEADHVYYVGDLDALVHNVWCDGWHHVIPKFLGGTDSDGLVYLRGSVHQELHELIDKALLQAFKGMKDLPFGRTAGKTAWDTFLRTKALRARAQQIAVNTLYSYVLGL